MLKFNTTQPIYKIVTLSALASLLFGGLAAQSAFAGTPVADGKIQAKEVIAAADVASDTDFKKLDVNSDKKISLKEAVKDKALVTSFDATDANKDGSLTPDEYTTYKMSMKSMDSPAPSSNAAPTGAAPASAAPANTGY
jgi:EF hand